MNDERQVGVQNEGYMHKWVGWKEENMKDKEK